MKRKDGYYWVIFENNVWEVGLWNSDGYWTLFDEWRTHKCGDSDMDKINENQIPPPND